MIRPIAGARRQRDQTTGVDLPVGQLLLRDRVIGLADLSDALERQKSSRRRIGEILVSDGAATAAEVAAAVAERHGLGVADLSSDPPDERLWSPVDLDVYIDHGLAPWRKIGGMTLYATTDPENAPAALGALKKAPPMGFFAVAERRQVRDAVLSRFGGLLAARAANRVPLEESARSRFALWQKIAITVLTLLVLAGLSTVPWLVGTVLALAAIVLATATGGLRLALLVTSWRRDIRERRMATAEKGPDAPVMLADRRAPPMVSILVPLYREAGCLPALIEALEKLDYPRELLDVKFLVEEDDAKTQMAIDALCAPPWLEVLKTPPGKPRTKPRALNFALDFCEGDIIGIYDAEDRPEPRQILKVVEEFGRHGPEVACLQARLGYFNTRENWITRCFSIEYAIWFDVLLRGMDALRLPIPLGGTSVFLRRGALKELGGWDAWNVTEDADLGMRLYRAGMRCGIVDSLTLEEANCRLIGWIRQRSRWLKGYMQTWITHMRRPVRLFREMGPAGFLVFQILFLGSVTAYLSQPLFWGALGWWVATGDPLWDWLLPSQIAWPCFFAMFAGQAVMLTAACRACLKRRQRWLIPWILTLPLYWPMGALAAYKALFELIVAPFYWDKTRHNVSQEARIFSRRARARRRAAAQR